MPIIDLPQRVQSDAAGAPPKFFSAQIAQARRFHLQARPLPGKRLSVVCGGCERCAADYQIRRATFRILVRNLSPGAKAL